MAAKVSSRRRHSSKAVQGRHEFPPPARPGCKLTTSENTSHESLLIATSEVRTKKLGVTRTSQRAYMRILKGADEGFADSRAAPKRNPDMDLGEFMKPTSRFSTMTNRRPSVAARNLKVKSKEPSAENPSIAPSRKPLVNISKVGRLPVNLINLQAEEAKNQNRGGKGLS